MTRTVFVLCRDRAHGLHRPRHLRVHLELEGALRELRARDHAPQLDLRGRGAARRTRQGGPPLVQAPVPDRAPRARRGDGHPRGPLRAHPRAPAGPDPPLLRAGRLLRGSRPSRRCAAAQLAALGRTAHVARPHHDSVFLLRRSGADSPAHAARVRPALRHELPGPRPRRRDVLVRTGRGGQHLLPDHLRRDPARRGHVEARHRNRKGRRQPRAGGAPPSRPSSAAASSPRSWGRRWRTSCSPAASPSR